MRGQSHWGEEATVDVVTRLRRVHVSANIRRVSQIPSARADAVSSINHSELSIVFATPDHIPALLKLAPKCPALKMIVSMEPLSEQTRKVLAAWGETLNIQIKEISERAYGSVGFQGVCADECGQWRRWVARTSSLSFSPLRPRSRRFATLR